METSLQMSGRLRTIVFFLLIASAAADRSPFKLEKSETVVKTDAGEIRVFAGRSLPVSRSIPIHIGFITMEPETLLIPQYIDANLIIFLRRGEGKIGWILKDNLVESRLKPGDVVRIPAGSAFFLVNAGKGQQLQIICSIDGAFWQNAPRKYQALWTFETRYQVSCFRLQPSFSSDLTSGALGLTSGALDFLRRVPPAVISSRPLTPGGVSPSVAGDYVCSPWNNIRVLI